MHGFSTSPSACCQVELEIAIAAPSEKVWEAIFTDIQLWWLPEFHVVDDQSTVSFDPVPGGSGLLETTSDGNSLLWYSVQMVLPRQREIFLTGHIAPQWGGPTTSMLKLSVVDADSSCILRVSDARHGSVDEEQMQAAASGWTQLFHDGLKRFVERAGE